MTQFDRASLDRLLPATPGAADWDDVLSRSAALQSDRRRHLAVLALAALVAVVGTASAIGSVRAFILDKGFIGLPPEGATPSTPESGELVIRWLGRSATLDGRPLVRAWVYADGRIVWSRTGGRRGGIPEGASELTSGYLEQRLIPEGVELLRSEVIGLLEGSGIPLETVPTDDEVSRFGVEVRDGDRLVRPRTEQLGDTTATPEQLAALLRIDALLTDTASELPASAWAVHEVRAYVPSHYAVCIRTSPPKDASHLLSLLPTRAADVLRDTGPTRIEGDVVEAREGYTVVLGRWVTYCSKLATEEAREVAEALSGFDPDPRFHNVVLAYRLAEPTDGRELSTAISFEPYFPHGQVTCSACG